LEVLEARGVTRDDSPEAERSGELKLKLDCGNVISWAMEQNAIPLIHHVRAFNDSDYDVEDLTIKIDLSPDGLKSTNLEIPELLSGQTITLEDIDLRLNPEKLHSLIEKRSSVLSLELRNSEKQRLARIEKDISVLACNQWSLYGALPELLAAFVLPNAHAVQKTLTIARDLLKEETADPSFCGYQSKSPARVRAMIDALYRAIQRLDVTYLSPPANFERDGQKIRFPDQLIRYRMGTCLDITVFLAACMEQIGLNPLIILQKTHAFLACWLVEDRFDIAVEEDVQTLQKMAKAQQILFFDSSAVTVRPPQKLSRAIEQGEALLEDSPAFLLSLDIRSARLSRILPLAIHSPRSDEESPEEVFGDVAEASDDYDDEDLTVDSKLTSEWSRIKTWKDKLLDLSLRNRLLNFRPESKSVIPLDIPDLSVFEDRLAENKSYLIEAKINLDQSDPRNAKLLKARGAEDLYKSERARLFARGRLLSELTNSDLAKRIKHIYRTARNNLQETGANTLYITLGMLEWYESETADKLRRAPILLVPVQLTRKRAGQVWRLSISEDETRINSTVLEKIKNDFSLDIQQLKELPVDSSGVDLKAIFQTIRKAIVKTPRWELKEQANIAILSFTKHLMWLDLENKMEALLKNELVQHLVKPKESEVFKDKEFFVAEQLDEELRPLDSHLVLGADSSQQAAIMSAANGHHFVLQGPPGTGKSQTIANVIAHFLSQDKTVLFVSEKMAALDVVYKRLKKVGLGDFCLELHSNKANKRKVCLSLSKTLDFEGPEPNTGINEIATSIARRRRQLNDYVRALHKSYPLGQSLYTALGRLSEISPGQILEDFDSRDVLELNKEQFNAQFQTLKEISEAAQDVGQIKDNVFHAVQFSSWSPLKAKELLSSLGSLIKSARALEETVASLQKQAPALAPESRYDYLTLIPRLFSSLCQSPRPSYALLSLENRSELQQRIDTVKSYHAQRLALESQLFKRWENALLRLDLNSLIASFRQYNDANFFSSWYNLRGPKKQLYAVLKCASMPANEDVLKDLIGARRCLEIDREIEPHITELERFLGSRYKVQQTDWQSIERLFQWIDSFSELLGQLDLHSKHKLDKAAINHLASDPDEQQIINLKSLGAPFEIQLKSFQERLEAVFKELDINQQKLLGQPWKKASLATITEQLEPMESHWDQLRTWSRLQERVDKAKDANVCPQFLAALFSGVIAPDQLTSCFERSMLDRFVYLRVDSDRLLSSFEGRAQNRVASDFSDKDGRFISLGGSRITRHLAKSLPKKSGNVNSQSEVGLLLREAKKKTRHKAIRKLLSEIPNLLSRLKPCFLMSPLSIAQYLPADGSPFDLVIFDEASQIPTHDAIGAIARGKQVVVVGDSKQLPPTRFFAVTSNEEEENPNDSSRMSELESILDECLASQVPSMMLQWHYRSRSEFLIAFSNNHYYDNKLNTFPAPLSSTPNFGVQFNYLKEAVYDKGNTRTNLQEAKQCVQWVVTNLKDPEKQGRSIGIVTFSIAQQGLVEDMLEVERSKHPEIEDYFSDRAPESVFVKNLENVQGDERDVILFSLCYGPDVEGKMSMNFGPLNREGGERRLNVAITRAREQLIIFSSLQPENIDLSRTRSVGVAHLKAFLRYARSGPAALTVSSNQKTQRSRDARLEKQLAQFLEQRGWAVDQQVGCSQYRMDLAIRDPQNSEQYLLGIEGDGDNYQCAATAADRDRIRGAVLDSLGWQRKRLWSMDWLFSKEKSFEHIHGTLEKLAGDERKTLSFLSSNSNVEPLIVTEQDAEQDADQDAEQAELRQDIEATAKLPEESDEEALSMLKDDVKEQTVDDQGLVSPYSMYEIPGAPLGARDDFLNKENTEKLRLVIVAIIKHEAPIHIKELTNRLAPAWQIERQIPSIKKRVLAVLEHPLMKADVLQRGSFLWTVDGHPEDYKRVRNFRADGHSRRFDYVSPEELAAAAYFVLERDISLSRSQLIKEAGKVLGFARIGKKSQHSVDKAIDKLFDKKLVKSHGQKITVL
jgi:hypothetical protein